MNSEKKKATTKKWFEANPEYAKEWREKNLEKCRERSRLAARRWRERHPEYAKKYYKENAEWIAAKSKAAKKANPEKFRERERRYWNSPKGRAGYLLINAKYRCKNVTITKQWIQERLDRGVCEVTGLPFIYDSSGQNLKNPWSPSLDRKVSGLGYTLENTQLVVWIYNVAKGSWKHEDVEILANAIMERRKAKAA